MMYGSSFCSAMRYPWPSSSRAIDAAQEPADVIRQAKRREPARADATKPAAVEHGGAVVERVGEQPHRCLARWHPAPVEPDPPVGPIHHANSLTSRHR